MNQIRTIGNLPAPVRRVGLLTEGMDTARETLRQKLLSIDINLANTLAMPPEIWECASVGELGTAAHLEECELQCLVDRKYRRYYLVAMSVDPERTRAAIDTTEPGLGLVEEEGPKPAMILLYTEVTHGQFKEWQAADMEKRRQLVREEVEDGTDDHR